MDHNNPKNDGMREEDLRFTLSSFSYFKKIIVQVVPNKKLIIDKLNIGTNKGPCIISLGEKTPHDINIIPFSIIKIVRRM